MADKQETKKYVVSSRVKHLLRFDGMTYATGETVDLSKVDANQVKACVASGLLIESAVLSDKK